jgi:hypothetical protein
VDGVKEEVVDGDEEEPKITQERWGHLRGGSGPVGTNSCCTQLTKGVLLTVGELVLLGLGVVVWQS